MCFHEKGYFSTQSLIAYIFVAIGDEGSSVTLPPDYQCYYIYLRQCVKYRAENVSCLLICNGNFDLTKETTYFFNILILFRKILLQNLLHYMSRDINGYYKQNDKERSFLIHTCNDIRELYRRI